ncbi:hypothetical protein [Sphingomonas sp. AX6]|uniref:hypothetical protein n=1 Tax=Sphingomonas sp. AX6 TaxID=2653171 RepID=UPI0012F1E06A|nr:hypothetical protein [Sphingomonas sp. AX6]VXC88260.1 hypothetical protein SPHINGOAX6_70082 [Sphingomonas sp. AX6]
MDRALEAMPQAIDVAAQKWLDFQQLKFIDDDLAQQVAFFLVPLEQGLSKWEAFESAPDGFFLIIAVKAIEQSGTHSRRELENALGVRIPDK